MSRYDRDVYFLSSLETLLKIRNKKELALKSKVLEKYVIQKNDHIAAFRLALELDDREIGTTKLQNFIINSGSSRYIFLVAREIKRSNVKKLQDAIIKYGNILQITKFGCFIKGANKKTIEDLIIKSNNAKSAYLYLKFIKSCNINRLKKIIFSSKKPRYLFTLSKLTKNKKDLNKIQELIINGNSYMYMRLFAFYIKTADIKRIEDKIIKSGNISEMKKFLNVIDSDRIKKISLLF